MSDFATNDIYVFSEDHRMKLNPKRCKEMLINFMSNPNFIANPIVIVVIQWRDSRHISYQVSI